MKKPKILLPTQDQVPLKGLRENVIMRLVRMLPALPFSALMYARYHRRLSLFRNPRNYSELVNHKKLYKHDPLLTLTADKYSVRQYVANKVGEEYLIPMQQVVERAEDLDTHAFKGRVVIKGTHGCNMTMAVDASQPFDRDVIVETGRRWLKEDWYHEWKEWAYKNITPRLIVEDFIGVDGQPPADYKFHVFNQRVAMVQLDTERFTQHRSTLFTPDWKRLNVGVSFELEDYIPPRPNNLKDMVALAEELSEDFDHVRVDLYNVNGRIYFGELTHYPGAASVAFDPPEFDDALGELWRNGTPIPKKFILD